MTRFKSGRRLMGVAGTVVLLSMLGGCSILTDRHARTSASSACLSQTGAPGSQAWASCMVRETHHLRRASEPPMS